MTAGERSRPDRRSRGGKLGWYAGAAIGPMSAAGAQFLLSLLLLSRLPVADFGRFSFLIVVSQFSIGLWSALFTAPLLVIATQGQARDKGGDELSGVVAAGFVALIPAAGLFAGIALGTGSGAIPAGLFALYAALVLLRQFARAWALAHGRFRFSMLSDVTYGALLLAGTGAMLLVPGAGVATALGLLAVAIVGGMIPLALSPGGALPRAHFRALGKYVPVWHRDVRWSLLGVVTTEATVNSHSYIVTALFGPAGFAPIAATALFVRPLTVAINALVEFDRARCARRLGAGDMAGARAARRQLRMLVMALWLATAVTAAIVLDLAPATLLDSRFGHGTVALGVGLWLAVLLARGFHAPEGMILQAAGRFRELAWISVWTAGLSLAAVVVAALWFGPLWSIAAIAVGEGAFALALWRAASRFVATAEHVAAPQCV